MNKEKLEKLNQMLQEAKEQLSALKELKAKNEEVENEADDDNEVETIFSCEKTSKRGKLVAGLYRMTSDYESLESDINEYCSETLYSYLTDKSLPTDEELKDILNVLEMPYKMYRRINDFLKKQ